MKPYSSKCLKSGELDNYNARIERHLTDMADFFSDKEGASALSDKNPLIYSVYEMTAPEESGQLSYATTILYPGKVGDEYYMTKGHFHSKENTGEIYYGMAGRGVLVMQKDGTIETIEMGDGVVAYVPPGWAHRSVNTGSEDFVFLAFYPADAGHDYGTIAEKGFLQIVVEDGGMPKLVSVSTSTRP